jgi:hypothetical protein
MPGREPAEERGPQQNADDDLAHRRGLPATPGDRAADAAGEHDDGELQEREQKQELALVRTRDGGARLRHPVRPSRR